MRSTAFRSGLLAAGCGIATAFGAAGGCSEDPPPRPSPSWTDCEGTDQAFARRAIRSLAGRPPWGQAEVNVYEDLLRGARSAGVAPDQAKRLVARVIMEDEAFVGRWSEFFKDALSVLRTPFVRTETYDLVQTQTCYASPEVRLDGKLAAWVRDNSPSGRGAPVVDFTLGQLLVSALELDDVSTIYRAHLFHMLTTPLAGANVDVLELERTRRHDFGTIFEASYLHRDPECLPCHNSESSVTYSSDPTANRAWPVPGRFEEALYGSNAGPADALRARSVLRHVGVADGEGEAPWGWSSQKCGEMRSPTEPDPLGVDASFGSVTSTPDEPLKGQFASVWTLELALRRGFESLAMKGLQTEGARVSDPDQAFAYLVAQNVVERVWMEVVGTPLTIANYFPRTEVQRDILASLTSSFVASRYSLKTLLADIAAHPAFNLRAPEDGCGAAAYELPRIFDPWTDREPEEKRPNSPADAVHAPSMRALRGALHHAMEWPEPLEFPRDEADENERRSLGAFVSHAEPGFRGLDFQSKLSWESLYAGCRWGGNDDFVARLVVRARATPGATLRDAVAALKDRLLGEPWVEDGAEGEAVEFLAGAPLDSTDLARLDEQLRSLCGGYVMSPQFLLGGLVARDTRDVPRLADPERSYGPVCEAVADRATALSLGISATCGESLEVAPR